MNLMRFCDSVHSSWIHLIPQPAQPIRLRLGRPNHTSPPRSRPTPTNFMPQSLPSPDHEARHNLYETRVLLEPPCRPQTLHRLCIVLSADVALRAVLRHDVGEAGRHDKNGKAGGDAPVVVDAEGGVIGVGSEVDVASILSPCASHAVASLISAKCSVQTMLAVRLGVLDIE